MVMIDARKLVFSSFWLVLAVLLFLLNLSDHRLFNWAKVQSQALEALRYSITSVVNDVFQNYALNLQQSILSILRNESSQRQEEEVSVYLIDSKGIVTFHSSTFEGTGLHLGVFVRHICTIIPFSGHSKVSPVCWARTGCPVTNSVWHQTLSTCLGEDVLWFVSLCKEYWFDFEDGEEDASILFCISPSISRVLYGSFVRPLQSTVFRW